MSNWVPAWRYSQGINAPRRKQPSLFVIHFAAMQSYQGLVNYFHNNYDKRYADATWVVGQKGEWCQMVKTQDTPWTNGNGLGKWIDENGVLTSLINDIAWTVETSNDIDGKHFIYTDAHYKTLAYLFRWTLGKFKFSHVTRICSHENLTPQYKVDVGPLFNWEYFLVKCVGVKQQIYDEYLQYLQQVSHITTDAWWLGPDADMAYIKKEISLDGALKVHRDLSGRPSAHYMDK